MKIIIFLFLALLTQASMATTSSTKDSEKYSNKQLLKLATEYNKQLPRKYGNLIVEKVIYLPDSRTFSTTHKLLDKDSSQMKAEMFPFYRHLSKDNIAKQLCAAQARPKSRAFLLKNEAVRIGYQYVDKHNKPLFAFSISNNDCQRR